MRTQLLTLPLLLLPLAACATGPTPQERQSLADGFSQYQSRQYASAENAAAAYIQKYPAGPNVDEAYYLRGIARASRNQNDAAAADLRMAIQSTSRNDLRAKSLHTLGDMAYEGQRWTEARTYYQSALQYYASPDATTLFRIGASYQAEGRWTEARPYFVQAASLPANASNASVIDRAKTRAILTSYNLQFGAYRDVPGAQTAAAALKNVGITPSIIAETRNGQTLYCVRTGNYRTLVDAEAAKNVAMKSYPTVIVVP